MRIRPTIVVCLAVLAVCSGCTLMPNTGLTGVDYSTIVTTTQSGRPVLVEDTLVQRTNRVSARGSISYETTRPSTISTGLVNADWEHVEGIYVPDTLVQAWALDDFGDAQPHLSRAFARALQECAPDLGRTESLPVTNPKHATRFGRVLLTEDGLTYYQIPLSRTKWKTELDSGSGGGGDAVRIISISFEVYAAGRKYREEEAAQVNLLSRYSFVNGSEAEHEFKLSDLDLSAVHARCEAENLIVNGIRQDQTDSGWMPVNKSSFNSVVIIVEDN